jgi:hypothetical protein
MTRTLLVLVIALLAVVANTNIVVVADMTNDETMSTQVDHWPPATSPKPSVQDLHREYNSIFKYGNRNAASHRWSTFLLDRAHQMTVERLQFFFEGFCAVSGSPVRPSDYNRYRLTLPLVGTGNFATGFMHYCCWPCVCDTQDFIRVDTLNVTSSDGISRQRHFAVIGNPCDHPEELDVPFIQPFGRQITTLSETAREVRCLDGGVMEGATFSDHGFIIIGMFFDAIEASEDALLSFPSPEPGRVTTVDVKGGSIIFQDEREWPENCKDRAANGYNSGMGEIFRRVCAISPISEEALVGTSDGEPLQQDPDDEQEQPHIATPNESEPSCEVPSTASTTAESS